MEIVPEELNQPRKLIWLVDTLERLTDFPPIVRKRLGFALYQAQIGQQHESAKSLRGFAETVWQVRARTIRAAPIERCIGRTSGMRSTSFMRFKRRQHPESQPPGENWT